MKLKTLIVSAAGLTMFASDAASAADYLIYNFAFSGSETRVSNAQPLLGFDGVTSGSIVYYLPTAFAGSSFATLAYPASPGASHTVTGSTAGNVFSLRDVMTGPYRASTRDATINACLSPGSATVDPSCSSVSFTDSLSLGTQGTDVRRLTGTITGLTVSEGFGSVTLGLASYPVARLGAAVPEPAAWAMTIAGVGAIGFALRRRSGAAATAATTA